MKTPEFRGGCINTKKGELFAKLRPRFVEAGFQNIRETIINDAVRYLEILGTPRFSRYI